MTTKASQENSERRYKSVSEYLENNNPKKALQELEKIVKKTNDESYIGQAFKALCLIRLSRADEAESILQHLCSNEGEMKDENTLQLLQFCFRETQREDRIASIFEVLAKKQPQNEELLVTLFNCQVKTYNFKRTQEVAARLFKLNPGRAHYSLNIAASLLLQAEVARRNETERALHARITYPLAVRMLEKHVTELNERRNQLGSRFFNERTTVDSDLISLYAVALERSQRYADAQQVLDQYRQFFDHDPVLFPYKSIELFRHACLWTKLFAFCESHLDIDPNAWLYFEGYVSATIEFIKQAKSSTGNQKDAEDSAIADRITFSNVLERIIRLRDEHKNAQDGGLETEKDTARRAPRLALLELASRACAAGLREQLEAALATRGTKNVQEFLVDSAFDYFASACTKPCCFEDLVVYLSAMDEASRGRLAERCQKLIADRDALANGASDSATVQNTLQSKLSLEQLIYALERSSGRNDNVSKTMQLYADGLHFGRDLPLTELQFADAAMLVAAARFDEAMRAPQPTKAKHRDALAVLLSAALQRSPHNHFFKLCLVRLFTNQFNAAQLSHRLADSMSIKNVQMGSMAHYVLFDLHRCGLLNNAAAFNALLLKYYMAGSRDCAEYMTNAFRIGQYFQLDDIIRYRMHLARSIEFAIAKSDACFFQLLQAEEYKQVGHALASLKTEELTELVAQTANLADSESGFSDLRDLAVFSPLRHDARETVAQRRRETFEDERGYLRLRLLELSILKALFADPQPNGDTLKASASSINELLAATNSSAKQAENEPANRDLYEPSRTMLVPFSRAKLGAFWTHLVAFATHKLRDAGQNQNQNGVSDHLNQITSWFNERLAEVVEFYKRLEAGSAPRFEGFVVLTHAIGCLAATCAIIRHRTRSQAAKDGELESKVEELSVGASKKNKKKQQKGAEPQQAGSAAGSTGCAFSTSELSRLVQLCSELATCLRDTATKVAGNNVFELRMVDIREASAAFSDETRAAFSQTLETILKSGKLFWDVKESRLVEAAASGTQTLQFANREAFGDYLLDSLITAVRTSHSESFKQLRNAVEKFSKLIQPAESS